jgi:hypothetical protein
MSSSSTTTSVGKLVQESCGARVMSFWFSREMTQWAIHQKHEIKLVHQNTKNKGCFTLWPCHLH